MNDQSQFMNQHQVINHLQLHKVNHSQQMMNQSQILNSQIVSQPPMVSQMNPPQTMNPMGGQPQMIAQPSMLNQSKMMSQSYGNWAQQPSNMPPMSSLKFPNQMKPMYGAAKTGRSNWKRNKVMDNRRKDVRRKDMVISGVGGSAGPVSGAGALGAVNGGYKPPTLNELEHQNRLKARRFYHKKKFNRMGPYAHAPRNTTSFLIRAKKQGGIASLVSPCPVTPALLPTPVLSPSREALVDMAKEEWGVDGYGTMKGLIRLRSSPGHEAEMDDYEDEDDGGSCESDVEEHLEVERRLDHDLSRFEMIYPNYGMEYNNVLENRVDDQDTHIAQLEEENLLLKEKLYLMERELGEIKRRMQFLESQNQDVEDINEDLVENVSENESEGTRDTHLLEKHDEADYMPQSEGNGIGEKEGAKECQDGSLDNQGTIVDTKDGTKEATLPNEREDLDMQVNKDETHDMKHKQGVAAEDYSNVNATESMSDKDLISQCGEMDIGNNLAKNDDTSNDLCMEDTVPHKEPDNGPSEQ